MRFFVFSSFCVGDGVTRYTMVVHGAVLPYASLARSNSTAFTKRKVTHSVALALSGVCGIEANPLPDVGQWRTPPVPVQQDRYCRRQNPHDGDARDAAAPQCQGDRGKSIDPAKSPPGRIEDGARGCPRAAKR